VDLSTRMLIMLVSSNSKLAKERKHLTMDLKFEEKNRKVGLYHFKCHFSIACETGLTPLMKMSGSHGFRCRI
jgi:hypothetical protein